MNDWTKKAVFAATVFTLGFAMFPLSNFLNDDKSETSIEGFAFPYRWLNDLLVGLAFSGLFAAIIFFVIALVRKGARIRSLFCAGRSFACFLLFLAGGYALPERL